MAKLDDVNLVHPARKPRPFHEAIWCFPERSGGTDSADDGKSVSVPDTLHGAVYLLVTTDADGVDDSRIIAGPAPLRFRACSGRVIHPDYRTKTMHNDGLRSPTGVQ
jgi:hypothetical protein